MAMTQVEKTKPIRRPSAGSSKHEILNPKQMHLKKQSQFAGRRPFAKRRGRSGPCYPERNHADSDTESQKNRKSVQILQKMRKNGRLAGKTRLGLLSSCLSIRPGYDSGVTRACLGPIFRLIATPVQHILSAAAVP